MLFKEVNKGLTGQNVDRVLKKYFSISRLAGYGSSAKVTATYSLTPKATPAGNGAESRLINDIYSKPIYQQELDEINYAINALGLISRQRIYDYYLSPDYHYHYEIYPELGVSRDTYYRELNQAKVEFAEAYKGGELLAFEK